MQTRDPRQRSAAGTAASYGLNAAQRRALPPFAALRAFEAIGTCGGIRRAADALSIDHAAVSRHLRTLEQWAGIALFDRSSGTNGRLTEAGMRFHETVARSLADISAAAMDFKPSLDDRHLVLWCAPGLASDWLIGRLGDFAADFPDIEIELQPIEIAPEAVDQNVDGHLHYVIDTMARDPGPAFRTMQLARPPILAVASPSFLAAKPGILSPSDLLEGPLLHEASFDQWRRWFAQHGVESEGRLEGPRFWQGHLTLAAARRGQGVALANALLVGDSLRSGELVEVGPFVPVFLGGYYFTSRRSRWRGAALVSFRRWLEKLIAGDPRRGEFVPEPPRE